MGMIDPPEEKVPIYAYALGDKGKVEHIASFQNTNDALMAVARLKQDDPCFVRRSDGSFTFAKLLSRTRGQDAQLELQVNINGATKTIPLTESARYVRPLRSMVHTAENKNRHRRDTPSTSDVNNNTKKSGGGRRGGLQRRASVHARVQSDTNHDGHHPSRRHYDDLHTNYHSGGRHESKQTPRASYTNYRRQSDHLASCPSGLHRRATFQADEPPSKMNLARPTTTTTSVQPRSILRRGSSFSIKTKHQHHHHVSPNKNSHRASDSTDAYELSSIEDDNESESSSDTESPQTSKPPADVAVQDDVKKIVLPGFDVVRFNEQSLLKAFSDIAKAKK